ncbi:hypothetical protein HK405_010973 [Cladochytrium tenue]|nr:hypothetical protein HK405_010973 [Cladochytrium tenue]
MVGLLVGVRFIEVRTVEQQHQQQLAAKALVATDDDGLGDKGETFHVSNVIIAGDREPRFQTGDGRLARNANEHEEGEKELDDAKDEDDSDSSPDDGTPEFVSELKDAKGLPAPAGDTEDAVADANENDGQASRSRARLAAAPDESRRVYDGGRVDAARPQAGANRLSYCDDVFPVLIEDSRTSDTDIDQHRGAVSASCPSAIRIPSVDGIGCGSVAAALRAAVTASPGRRWYLVTGQDSVVNGDRLAKYLSELWDDEMLLVGSAAFSVLDPNGMHLSAGTPFAVTGSLAVMLASESSPLNADCKKLPASVALIAATEALGGTFAPSRVFRSIKPGTASWSTELGKLARATRPPVVLTVPGGSQRDTSEAASVLAKETGHAEGLWGEAARAEAALLAGSNACARTIYLQQELLRSLYGELLDGVDHVALLGFPDHSNKGDSAIWVGERALLAELGVDVVYLARSLNDFNDTRMIESLAAGHGGADSATGQTGSATAAIMFHGGGNFGDLYWSHQALRNAVAQSYPGFRIVSFPQTVHFSEEVAAAGGGADALAGVATAEGALAMVREAYKRHGNLTLVGRDARSFAVLRRYFGAHHRVALAPDIAFMLGPVDRASGRWRPNSPGAGGRASLVDGIRRREWEDDAGGIESDVGGEDAGGGNDGRPGGLVDVLVQQRTDKEGRREQRSRAAWRELEYDGDRSTFSYELGDWLGGDSGTKKAASAGKPDERAEARTRAGLDFLWRGRLVVTNRLHGHILSMLMGKPHVLLDNLHGKVVNYHATWTQTCTLARFAASVPEAIRLAHRRLVEGAWVHPPSLDIRDRGIVHMEPPLQDEPALNASVSVSGAAAADDTGRPKQREESRQSEGAADELVDVTDEEDAAAAEAAAAAGGSETSYVKRDEESAGGSTDSADRVVAAALKARGTTRSNRSNNKSPGGSGSNSGSGGSKEEKRRRNAERKARARRWAVMAATRSTKAAVGAIARGGAGLKLFLFRNIISGQVIVSHLNQIGENRSGARVRHDRWVPFAVVTGIPDPTTHDAITRALLPSAAVLARRAPGPAPKLPLPPPKDAPRPYHPNVSRTRGTLLSGVPDRGDFWQGWKVPEALRTRTLALCLALMRAGPPRPSVTGTKSKTEAPQYTVWWERNEFCRLPESQAVAVRSYDDPFETVREELFWPEWVAHRPLPLRRGHAPIGLSPAVDREVATAYGGAEAAACVVFAPAPDLDPARLHGTTLVVPAPGSSQMLGQLAVDLILAVPGRQNKKLLGLRRAGLLRSRWVAPVVGCDAVATSARPPSGSPSYALEVFFADANAGGAGVAVVQFRSEVQKGAGAAFAAELADWASTAGLVRVVVLAGADASRRVDAQLAANPDAVRVLTATGAAAAAGSNPWPLAQPTAPSSSSWWADGLLVPLEPAAPDAGEELAAGRRGLPDGSDGPGGGESGQEVGGEDEAGMWAAPRLPLGVGLAHVLLEALETAGVPTAVLVSFAARGDNTARAAMLATATMRIAFGDGAGEDAGAWEIPLSWGRQMEGREAPVELFQ